MQFQEMVRDGTIAKLMLTNAIYHSFRGEDGCADDDDEYIDLGDDSDEKLCEMLDKRIKEASDIGLSERVTEVLRSLVHKFKEVFRIRLGSGPPADAAPMTVKIKPGARLFRAKARRYKAEKRKFMNKYLKELVERDSCGLTLTLNGHPCLL